MRNSYPLVENVLKIDSGDYSGKRIFPSYAAGSQIHQKVESLITGAMKGSRDPLMYAYEGVDRNSGKVLVNVWLIGGYTHETLDVPADIKELVLEYNELHPKYHLNQINDEELDMELHKEITKLGRELDNYFSKFN